MLRQMKLPEPVIDYLVYAYPKTLDPKFRYIVWLGKQMIEQVKSVIGKDPRKVQTDPEKIAANRAYSQVRAHPMDSSSISTIIDWAVQTKPDIMQMSWNDAWRESENWHEQLLDDMDREKTESYMNPSKVVFRISNGWTVNKLEPDDCEMEGDIMGHCVGGYARAVASGRTNIYSLRDPKGEPHATIEITTDTNKVEGEETALIWQVVQIQGKSNNEPIDEYKAMLREWFESVQNDGINVEWEYVEEPELDHIRDYEPPLRNQKDDYGIIVNQEDPMSGDWDDMLERAFNEGWTNDGQYFSESNATDGIDAILTYFEQNIKDKPPELAVKTFDFLEEAATKFDEQANDEWHEYEDMNWEHLPHYPQEEDFEDEEGEFNSEKYDEALGTYYDEISYYMNDFSWLQFTSYLWTKLNEMRERFHPRDQKVEEPVAEPVMAWYEKAVKSS